MIDVPRFNLLNEVPKSSDGTCNYFLRNINSKLWLRCRVLSTEKKISVRKVIISLLQAWVDNKVIINPK